MTPPGARLRALASHLVDPSTMERLIDPAIADLQHEHDEAVVHGPVITALAALTVCFGYYALLYGARQAMFSRDWLPPIATAWMQWMPNVTVVAIALLSFRRTVAIEPTESSL
jgi:hypothetical protein